MTKFRSISLLIGITLISLFFNSRSSFGYNYISLTSNKNNEVKEFEDTKEYYKSDQISIKRIASKLKIKIFNINKA